MPINKTLGKSLQKEYGKKKGIKVMFAMENSKGKTGRTYKKGLATAKKQGHTLKSYKKLK